MPLLQLPPITTDAARCPRTPEPPPVPPELLPAVMGVLHDLAFILNAAQAVRKAMAEGKAC